MKVRQLIQGMPSHYSEIKKMMLHALKEKISGITESEFWGVVLTVALCMKEEEIISAIRSDAAEHLDYGEKICEKAAIYSALESLASLLDEESIEDEGNDDELDIVIKKSSVYGDRLDFEMYMFAGLIARGARHSACIVAKNLMEQGVQQQTIDDLLSLVSIFVAIIEAYRIETMHYNDFIPRY